MAQPLSHDAAYRQILGDWYMMRELRTMVELLLTDRFGTELPVWVLHELAQADEAQLMQWARGISRAPSLAAVFGRPSG